ncbi:MAG TPA: recombinase RecT [Chryseolinea sp.]|nr:recombinase RecT [Chryseolinea sp.]
MTLQNNGQAPAATLPVKSPTKSELMMSFFEKDTVKKQMQNALQENAPSFIASVIDLYTGDDTLAACHPELVAMQALKAAVLKLPIIKALGFAYIVPYRKGDSMIPQFQIGYKGLIQLAIRTNQYRIINADVVYEGEYRSSNKLTGEFDLTGTKKSDTIVGYFAYFETKEGFSKTLFMSKERVTAHAQKYSKSYSQSFSPWKTEFDAMSIKTVLRGLISHWGIMSTEMQSAITDDDRDVAERTIDEINRNGNTKDMKMDTSHIEDAEFSGGNNESDSLNGRPF